jgi:hypothetical protein
VRNRIDAAGFNWGRLVFLSASATYSCDQPGWENLMAIAEVEKSSRSTMERTFYAKLGPTPGFPSSPAGQTGQGEPTK